jgi:hypothetical protein
VYAVDPYIYFCGKLVERPRRESEKFASESIMATEHVVARLSRGVFGLVYKVVAMKANVNSLTTKRSVGIIHSQQIYSVQYFRPNLET